MTLQLQINIRDLTNDEFNSLLSELFLNGNITRERIVVLFFFCSDLAISAITNGPIAYFKRLIQWSLNYILNNICQWVQRQGGWVWVTLPVWSVIVISFWLQELVLGTYIPRMAITACAVMGCIAFAIYIRRNIWDEQIFSYVLLWITFCKSIHS